MRSSFWRGFQVPAWEPPEPTGDCILYADYDGGVVTALRVGRADPRVLVAGELVERIRAGEGAPLVTLEGDLLKIHATNRRVVYRLLRYVPAGQAWEAEWPD